MRIQGLCVTLFAALALTPIGAIESGPKPVKCGGDHCPPAGLEDCLSGAGGWKPEELYEKIKEDGELPDCVNLKEAGKTKKEFIALILSGGDPDAGLKKSMLQAKVRWPTLTMLLQTDTDALPKPVKCGGDHCPPAGLEDCLSGAGGFKPEELYQKIKDDGELPDCVNLKEAGMTEDDFMALILAGGDPDKGLKKEGL